MLYKAKRRHCIVITSTPTHECTTEKVYQILSHSNNFAFKSLHLRSTSAVMASSLNARLRRQYQSFSILLRTCAHPELFDEIIASPYYHQLGKHGGRFRECLIVFVSHSDPHIIYLQDHIPSPLPRYSLTCLRSR